MYLKYSISRREVGGSLNCSKHLNQYFEYRAEMAHFRRINYTV